MTEIFAFRNGEVLNEDLHSISPSSFTIKRYRQDDKIKPRELDITVDRRTPLPPFGRIVAIDDGDVVFNGFVERQSSMTMEKRRFLCKGNEAYLYGRYMPKHAYSAFSLSLQSILSSMIEAANSFWPPGTPYTIYDSSKNIILLRYINSHMDVSGKALSALIPTSVYGRPFANLTERENLSDLQTNDDSYYVDSQKDVYVRVTSANWYAMGGLFCKNAFDTFCRLGYMEYYWNVVLRGSVFTSLDEVATLFMKLVKRHGYYLRLEDDRQYTHLVLSRSGRVITGATIYEKDLLDYERSTPAQPPIQAAIVQGAGYQFASLLDGRIASKYFRIQNYDNTFNRNLGMLQPLAADYFSQQNSGDTVRIELPPELAKARVPAEELNLALEGEPVERFQVAQISNTDDEKCTVQLGTRVPGLGDIWQEKLEVMEQSLYEILPAFSESVTFKPRDMGHATCTKGSVEFDFPTNILGPNGDRFLALMDISFSLNWQDAADDNPWQFVAEVNGESGDWGNVIEASLDEGMESVDISDLIVEGTNTIEIIARYSSEFSTAHGGCNAGEMFPNVDWITGDEWNGHPDITANVSIRFYRMSY